MAFITWKWRLNAPTIKKMLAIHHENLFDKCKQDILNHTAITIVQIDLLATTETLDEDEFNDSIQYALEIIEKYFNFIVDKNKNK